MKLIEKNVKTIEEYSPNGELISKQIITEEKYYDMGSDFSDTNPEFKSPFIVTCQDNSKEPMINDHSMSTYYNH